MGLYEVTVTARFVLTVEARDDGQAGLIAKECVDASVAAGRQATPLPPSVHDLEVDTFVQAASMQ